MSRSRWPTCSCRLPKNNTMTSPENTPTPSSKKSARSRAREFALQALYQRIVGKNDPRDIDMFTRNLSGFHKADSALYDALLYGCAEESQTLDEAITPLLDRPLEELSPIERAAMWMAVYEFKNALDVPWKVVINEYVELTKSFGGTDGHKYVNAVLNGLAPQYRAAEINATKG
ncbi:transcription antitermination factor NusB [Lampropedia aestuarii]|uniref:transcription antitermination factor NusB n=1 Tax=Lampropedia aestuarii TaxID=2562762 RepID=UPI001F10CDE8|nr:transcription antitermination factor NusB [Lampropedia aestuarii]MDH5859161.1 transcription antitermination factor NusB [Lampropedia aestuarii]